jgi:hypothetical protein
MSYIYNTRLICKSSSKLLQKIDPNEIIKDLSSKFLSCENGAYHFTTRNGRMHESIVVLSEQYPTEIFLAQFWDVESYDSKIQTYKYIDGFSKCTKTEPNYMYCVSHIEKIMGKKTVRRFMNVVLKHFKKIDAIDVTPTTEKHRMERKHKIGSSITINVENEKYKIESTRIGYAFIEVNGFVKESPTPRWKLIEKEKSRIMRITHQMDKSADDYKEEKYEDLPF